MIRPCDQCGGSGEVHEGDFVSMMALGPCPRCVDMPRLIATIRVLNPHIIDEAWNRGWFKPDPDTIERRCVMHGCVNDAGFRGWCLLAWAIGRSEPPCEWVWVPAITEADRLEEA